MIEVYLVITGIIFFAWLFALVRQTQQGMNAEEEVVSRPIVPVNLMDAGEAVLMAESRGRIVYANDKARQWFGINGGALNLSLMAQMIQPSDTLHDLVADVGQAAFRLGTRRIEAVSHAVPGPGGHQMVVVMREVTASALHGYTDFDPLRALTIMADISQAVGGELDLDSIVDAVLRSLGQAITFDSGEVTLWHPETQTLRPVGHSVLRTPTGTLDLDAGTAENVYPIGDGYSGWIALYRQPLLISDIAVRTDVLPQSRYSQMQSYAGVPLLVSDRFIGTMELASYTREAFSQRDMSLLQTVAGQVAAGVEVARLYRDQTVRVAELTGLQQIAEAMSQLGDTSELYAQLTARIASLMGVELCGVLLYDEDDRAFHSQPPFYGIPDTLIRHYELPLASNTELHTVWQQQPWWYTNDADSDLIRSMGFQDLISAITLTGMALVPMIVGARRIGLLMVANRHGGVPFTDQDMRALMSFASQAAVVAENARLYTEEQRRTRELSGLQQIAQAIGVLRRPEELFGQITAHIAALMQVEMCGVLIYDPQEHLLVSQRPFYGMDDEESVRFYQIPSPPGSAMAKLWMERDYWYSNNIRVDSVIGETGLARLSSEIGIRQTVIATLIAGGVRLGIIQTANRIDASDFSEGDARILSIFAGQAAVLIDNSRLYYEMQRRTHEAEGLRAITEIASQGVPNQDTVEQVITAIANVLESLIVSIALVDERSGQLVIQPGYTWGTALDEPYIIDTYASDFEHSVLITRRAFLSNNLREDKRVLSSYRPLIEKVDAKNAIQVPLVIQGRGAGELSVANKTTGPYVDTDRQLLEAIATQIAAMLERERLYKVTDQDLRTRVQELEALSRVTEELSQTLDLDHILGVIRQEALRSTPAIAASVVLLSDPKEWDAPDQPRIDKRLDAISDSSEELAPIELSAVSTGQRVLVPRYDASDLEAKPPKAQSALVTPVRFGSDVVGLIHIYSDRSDAIDQRSIDFIETLAAQAAVAIGNARRFEEQMRAYQQLRVRTERIGRLFELGELFRRGATLSELLEEVAHSVQETVGFNMVLINIVDEREGVLRRTAQAGLPLAVFEEMQNISPPVEQAQSLMQDAFRISHSYFLPAEGAEDLVAGLPVYAGASDRGSGGPRTWNPQDLLLVPLYGSGRRLLGTLTVDDPRSGRRPDLDTVEALEIFASQASFAVENFRLIERIQQEAQATRRERDRLAQLHMVASEIQGAPDVPSRLKVVADGIHTAGWGHVVITLRDKRLEPTALIQTGYTPDEALHLSDEVLPGTVWRKWINDLAFHEMKLGAGYYLRYSHPWVEQNVRNGQPADPPSVPDDVWHPQDIVYLTLVGQDQKRIIGIIEMTDPVDGRVPNEALLQPFELFASQAAAAIETTRLYLETVRAAEQEQRLNEIMEVVSSSLSPSAVIEAVGYGLQQMVPFTRLSVSLLNEQTGQFDVLRGDLNPDGSVTLVEGEPLTLDRTATGMAFRETKAAIYRLTQAQDIRETYTDLSEWYDTGERSILIAPMVAGGKAIGALHLGSELENAFGFQENLDMIQRLANLSAVSLDNARLFQQVQDRAVELDAHAQRLALFNRVSAQLVQTLDPREVYHIILRELQEALDLQSAGLMLVDEAAGISRLVVSTHPMDPPEPDLVMPLDTNPVAQYMMATHQPVMAEDLLNDPRFEGMHEVSRARGTQAMMIIPVMMGDRLIGTIGMDSSTPRHFTEVECEIAMTLANQASVAIEKARLFNETQQRAAELDAQARRLALLNRVSIRLAETLDPQAIYQIGVGELQEILGAQYGELILFEDAKTGRLVVSTHPDDVTSDAVITITLKGNPSIAHVRKTRRPLASSDVLEDKLFKPTWKTLRQRGTVSLMIVPLIVGEEVIGTIGLDYAERHEFTEAEIDLAQTIASQASLAIEKARLYDETLGLTIFNQAVVESIQQGIVVLNQDLTVRRINRFMVERYGWDMSGVGKPLFAYRPDYGKFLRQPIVITVGTGEPQTYFGAERVDAEGNLSIRNYYVYPMLEGKNVTGIVLLVEDVTERARLEADVNARAVQMAALSEVSSQITSTLEPDQVINLVLDALGRVIPYDGVSLWLRSQEKEELNIVAARGYQDPDSPDADALIGLTVEIAYSPLFREMSDQARVINVGDVGAGDPRFPYGSAAIYKNWLGAPLISKGNVVGVLALEKREENFYTALHEQLALTFANQAAVALYNAQLFQETRDRALALDEQAQRLALLNRVSLALAQSLDIENILEISLRETAIALGMSEGSAMQLDRENNLVRVIVEYPRGDAPPERVIDISRNSVIQRVQQNLIPLALSHLNEEGEEVRASVLQLMRREDIFSTLFVPLVIGPDVIGILRLDEVGQTREFTAEQIGLAQTIASQAAIAVQNAALFEQTSVRTSELETLFVSAQATAVTLDLNEVVRRVTVQMLGALGADSCTIFLWDDVSDLLEVRDEVRTGVGDEVMAKPGDICHVVDYPLRERALRSRELIIIRMDEDDLPPGEAALMEQHQAASRMLIPLIVNEISIGLVEVETLDPNHYFKSENVRMARTLASQAAISIENARLQTETRRTVEELYIINDMAAALSSATNLEQLLSVVEAQLPNLTDAQALFVAIYDRATETISFPLATSILTDQPIPMEDRPLGTDEFSLIIKQQSPLLLVGENLPDIRRNLHIDSSLPTARAFLGVPLFAGEEIIGVLAVTDEEDTLAFGHNDRRILTTVGSQLGVVIQSARLFEQTVRLAEVLDQRVRERTAELEQERHHLSTLYQITTELATSLDMERLLNRALTMVAQSVNATQGAILAIDSVSEQFHFRASYGWPNGTTENSDQPSQSFQMDQGLAGWAVQNHQSLIVDDVQDDPRWLRLEEADDKPRAAMAALIEAGDDVLGVMMLYSEISGAFHEDHLRLVTAATNQIANAMNNAELYSLIRDQAERLGVMLRQEQIEATKSSAILDSVADGVMVSDDQGQVIVFNTTAERILGLPAQQVLNQPITAFAGLYGAEARRWADAIAVWMARPDEYRPGEFLEERITLEDGRIINVRLSPVHLGAQFLGTVSSFRDITQEVEVDRLKSEFVATVSHELRTPMTSIKGYADLLLLGAAGEVTEPQQRFLETIKQNADRLSILVNDLLDISRIDQGRIELKPTSIPVDSLFEMLTSYVQGRCDDQKRSMNIHTVLPEGDPPVIWGDFDKVRQIFSNLADNSFNYTLPGGDITFSVVRNPDNQTLILSVSDTGIGIPDDVADRVFERFFRGDESQELVMDTPGTGLGLSIVREFVQLHQGKIWFESEEGRGTTFYVELPSHSPPGAAGGSRP